MRGSSNRLVLVFGLILWATGSIYGFAALWTYQYKQGESGDVVWRLPKGLSLQGPRNEQAYLLIHPRCPCSRASLTEFVGVLRKAGREGIVVFWVPNKESLSDPDWTETDLVFQAKANHSVLKVNFDPEGRICQQLGVGTSGHCLVFSDQGVLKYSGGVTASRGHQGPNNGAIAAAGALSDSSTNTFFGGNYPVYGCSF